MRSNFNLLIAYTLVILVAGFWIGRGSAPKPVETISRVVLGTEIPKDPKPSTPTIEYRYRELPAEKVTDTVFIPLPKSLSQDFYVSSTRPISISGRQVSFSYYIPEESRFGMDVYTVPDPRWGYHLDAITVYNPIDARLSFGLGGALRYRRVSLFAEAVIGPQVGGYTADFSSTDYRLTAGVRVRFLGHD